MTEPPALYFLSDYGTTDEFVGVVHAVLHRLAPATTVIDLSHHVPAFDVAAGAALLARSAPHLGPGVVLAVVDPGVGTQRRAVAVRAGGRWLVGPDNGLLVPAARVWGGADQVLDLGRSPGPGATFDGRDLFGPAAAHLVTGGGPDQLGHPVDPATLVVLADDDPGPVPVEGRTGPSSGAAVGTVTWIDTFGNAQTDLGPAVLADLGIGVGDRALVAVGGSDPVPVRRVEAFGQLVGDELGLLEDANGHLALVVDRASASDRLGLARPGPEVRITRLPADPPTGGR